MRKIMAVAKREFLIRVKRRSFLVFTLLGPLLIVGIYALPILFMSLTSDDHRLAVADLQGGILPGFHSELDSMNRLVPEPGTEEEESGGFALVRTRFELVDETRPGESMESARERLNLEVSEEHFDAYLIIGPDPDSDDNVLYGSRTSGGVPDEVKRALRTPILAARAEAKGLGLDSEEILTLARRVEVIPVRVSDGGEVSSGDKQQSAVIAAIWAMGMIFYMVFLIWGANILRGVVEEKSTRVIEVLLSSMTSTQFMVGKVTGIGLVAMTQVVVWATSGLIAILYGGMAVPELGEILVAIDPALFAWFPILFLLGFAMYAVIYAAMGSTVTSTQEAEQAAMPIVVVIIASLFAMMAVQRAPDSTFAVVASMFPLTAPLNLLMRIGVSDIPAWQIFVSLLLQVLAIVGLAWLAARIFRVGVLMYGKRATIPEIVRWMRTA